MTRNANFIIMIAVLAAAAQAQTSSWTPVSGGLKQVSAASDGTVFGVNNVNEVYYWTGSQWTKTPGQLVQVSAGNARTVWGVNAAGEVFQYSNSNWQKMAGSLAQVSAAADGTVVGVTPSGSVMKWSATGWTPLPGNMKQVAAIGATSFWGLNSTGEVFLFDGATWQKKPGTLKQISASSDGSAAGVNSTNEAWEWTGSDWRKLDRSLTYIALAKRGDGWAIADNANILRFTTDSLNISSPNASIISINSTLVVPPDFATNPEASIQQLFSSQQYKNSAGQLAAAQMYWMHNTAPNPPGALSCINCGTTNADYAGPYKLNLTCPNVEDKYKTDWGGTCWRCPAQAPGVNYYDYPWAWVVMGDVKKDGYCERLLKPPLPTAKSTMTKGGVNSGVMAWDCPSDNFWQMYDSAGNWTWWGGACYGCPAGYTWNLGSPTSGSDCVKQKETAAVRLANFNGCPAPDAQAMNLKDKRAPDKPFLDIAGGWSQGSASGGCYACPAVLEDGSIVVASRNATSLINNPNNNNGCDVKVKYAPKAFPEPGLMGLDGVKDVIVENGWFMLPDLLTHSLHMLAEAQGMAPDSAAARAFVKAKWEEIAKNPATSPEFRGALYGLIRDAALRADRTPAEAKLLASFEEYIRRRRMYMAAMSLHMYDRWKEANDAEVAAKRNVLSSFFYYGTVPYDFNLVVQTSLGFGAVSAAGLGSVASSTASFATINSTARAVKADFLARHKEYSSIADLLKKATTTTSGTQQYGVSTGVDIAKAHLSELNKTLNERVGKLRIENIFKGNLMKGLTTFRVVTFLGPLLIQTAAAVLIEMAIDQFIEISTARQKLLDAQTAAAKPVSLPAMMGTAAGEDETFMFWVKATGESTYFDPDLAKLAVAAKSAVERTAYAKP